MAARHSKKHGRHKARHAVPSSKPAIIKSMFVPKDRFYTAVMQGVHDSMERERKRTRQAMHTVVAALAIIVLIGSICFGWMGARASLRTHELVRVSTCQQAVIDMNNSYFKASQLKRRWIPLSPAWMPTTILTNCRICMAKKLTFQAHCSAPTTLPTPPIPPQKPRLPTTNRQRHFKMR